MDNMKTKNFERENINDDETQKICKGINNTTIEEKSILLLSFADVIFF